jgi:hypothetical protein
MRGKFCGETDVEAYGGYTHARAYEQAFFCLSRSDCFRQSLRRGVMTMVHPSDMPPTQPATKLVGVTNV